jgi:secreted trypsin-like serine protease
MFLRKYRITFLVLFYITSVASKGFHSQCGKQMFSAPLIFNGEKSQPGQWPWHVALLKETNNYFCGGTIISNLHVLTGIVLNKENHSFFNYYRSLFTWFI